MWHCVPCHGGTEVTHLKARKDVLRVRGQKVAIHVNNAGGVHAGGTTQPKVKGNANPLFEDCNSTKASFTCPLSRMPTGVVVVPRHTLALNPL